MTTLYFDRSIFSGSFGDVRLAARIYNAQSVDNDEEGAPVWLCRDQQTPWPVIWDHLKHYG